MNLGINGNAGEARADAAGAATVAKRMLVSTRGEEGGDTIAGQGFKSAKSTSAPTESTVAAWPLLPCRSATVSPLLSRPMSPVAGAAQLIPYRRRPVLPR